MSLSIAPYGYTLTIWTSGAVLTHARGVPSTLDALLFMVGAVSGFLVVGVAAFGALHGRVVVETQQPRLWAGLHMFSIGLAIGAASALAHLIENGAAWPVGGLAATTIYLALLAGQLTLAG